MTLGKVLKRIRKTKQIPQKEIVKVLKISKSTVYRFEKVETLTPIIILSIVSIWVLMQEFLILSAIMMIFIDCLIELHEVHLIMKYLSWLFQKL